MLLMNSLALLKPYLCYIIKVHESLWMCVWQILGIPVIRVAGVEADDVIGTVARRASEEGFLVAIASPDKVHPLMLPQQISLSMSSAFWIGGRFHLRLFCIVGGICDMSLAPHQSSRELIWV